MCDSLTADSVTRLKESCEWTSSLRNSHRAVRCLKMKELNRNNRMLSSLHGTMMNDWQEGVRVLRLHTLSVHHFSVKSFCFSSSFHMKFSWDTFLFTPHILERSPNVSRWLCWSVSVDSGQGPAWHALRQASNQLLSEQWRVRSNLVPSGLCQGKCCLISTPHPPCSLCHFDINLNENPDFTSGSARVHTFDADSFIWESNNKQWFSDIWEIMKIINIWWYRCRISWFCSDVKLTSWL